MVEEKNDSSSDSSDEDDTHIELGQPDLNFQGKGFSVFLLNPKIKTNFHVKFMFNFSSHYKLHFEHIDVPLIRPIETVKNRPE